MGIYIKGMDMPVSCWYCDPDFAYAINCNEWKRPDFPHFITSRPDTCPLTEVSEPHGRLIDADALVEGAEQYELEGGTFCIDSVEDLYAWLYDNAPTIIESEEEE